TSNCTFHLLFPYTSLLRSNVHRPVRLDRAFLIRIAQGSDVVGQGIEPDVDDMPFVSGNRNAPIEGGPGDGEVAQAFLYEGNDLVDRKSTRLNSSHVKISYA